MKAYRAIFFDWDGTAVQSRKAPVHEIVLLMKELLVKGIKLVIISGTTIENIGEGELHTHFSMEERKNLFYGLGRGAYNYCFDEQGNPKIASHRIPNKEEMIAIHRVCYELHEHLLQHYNFPTDIVFSRPNYCKINLMVSNNRGDKLFLQENELECLKEDLTKHGFKEGITGLAALAEQMGASWKQKLCITSDAKYLEVGISSKSDNVNDFLDYFWKSAGIEAKECAFWGDEYIGIEEGMFGSDSFMITEKSKKGNFFDVSIARGKRPEQVMVVGGGVKRFLKFLEEQIAT